MSAEDSGQSTRSSSTSRSLRSNSSADDLPWGHDPDASRRRRTRRRGTGVGEENVQVDGVVQDMPSAGDLLEREGASPTDSNR